ncbi:MAG: SMC-Scp complex subunit ScpB [Endozoicomonas sp. (ex Botrylloides leachii)]|nr:SMC-Scp complex subunit ScpB [Endozoicomonas sp. (ex Botrylloides leachii)]
MNDTNEDTENKQPDYIEQPVAEKNINSNTPWIIDPQGPALELILEGILMASGKPLTIDQLALLFAESERPSITDIEYALKAIANDCKHRGVELKQVASGYRFQVKQAVAPWVSRLWEEKPQRYTRALLETLALIAYRQPITRGEIEGVRGVSVSSNIIKTLQEREWVRVVGYREVPGRPAMFATTRYFLDYFNLKNLNELPSLSDIRNLEETAKKLESQTDMLEDLEPEQTQVKETEEESQALTAENLFAELDEMEVDLPENFDDLIKKKHVESLNLQEPSEIQAETEQKKGDSATDNTD